MIYVVTLVIFITILAAMLWAAWRTGEADRVPLARLADPRPLPGELPIAGYFDLPDTLVRVATSTTVFHSDDLRFKALTGEYGPFPVDTGPLLIVSETRATGDALEREIRQRCAEAEAQIPPRWR